MTQKVWFITGASRGLGAEVAKAALAAGEKVIATRRGRDGLNFAAHHAALLALEMDVTDQIQIEATVKSSMSRFGRIDVLVNNAGFGLLGAIEETTVEQVERIYRTNVFGLLNVIRAALPIMRQQRAGHIINFSSLGGFRASAGWASIARRNLLSKELPRHCTMSWHLSESTQLLSSLVSFEPTSWTAVRSLTQDSSFRTMRKPSERPGPLRSSETVQEMAEWRALSEFTDFTET